MYLPNKYTKWYNDIINRSKSRVFTNKIYIENHHIIPRALNGNNSNENTARLTAREHFICHWLLTKMTTGTAKQKMCGAFMMLSVSNKTQHRYTKKINSKMYENYRIEFSKYNSTLMRMRMAKLSAAHRKEIYGHYGENNGFYNRTHSKETLLTLSISHKKQRSILHLCKTCGGTFDKQNFIRFHGINCGKDVPGVRGRKWYHLDAQSFYLFPNDQKILDLGLTSGRAKNPNLGRRKL